MSGSKFVRLPQNDMAATVERLAARMPSERLAEHRRQITGSLETDISSTRRRIAEAVEGLPPELRDLYGRLFESQLAAAEAIICRLVNVAEAASRITQSVSGPDLDAVQG